MKRLVDEVTGRLVVTILRQEEYKPLSTLPAAQTSSPSDTPVQPITVLPSWRGSVFFDRFNRSWLITSSLTNPYETPCAHVKHDRNLKFAIKRNKIYHLFIVYSYPSGSGL